MGIFDGVHLGHRAILQRLNEVARRENGESVVLTFYPHPRMVLFPDDNDLQLLSTMEEKIALLEKTGVDHLIIHPFSREFSRTTAVEYVRDILSAQIGATKLVIGYDHHFGRNREGSLEKLKELAPEFNFEVEEIPAQEIDSVNVSSTKIRKALERGDITTANQYLCYSYPLSGKVIHGDKIGREIGYPTANLSVADKHKLIPADGVYIVRVVLGSGMYMGMANIGVRPTLPQNRQQHKIEAHVFDFEGDLYDSEITICFEKWLRPEEKFKNLEELRVQLEKDEQAARSYFASVSETGEESFSSGEPKGQ